MIRHAEWEVVNQKPGIILIRDLDQPGCLSITNDAFYVYETLNRMRSGDIRVIYQDTDGEWAEIVKVHYSYSWGIEFRPWHGEVWDNLVREY